MSYRPGEMSISAQNNAFSSCDMRSVLKRAEKPNRRSTKVAPSSNVDLRWAHDTMQLAFDVVGKNMTLVSPSMYAAWITHVTFRNKNVHCKHLWYKM